eukprot:SRR837773.25881.p3 GENE.SRR837773.25881~~SRR837773.25881.p3  ORF type:complete len:126 (-),score=21.25 SRR837773.25881:528-860(-)
MDQLCSLTGVSLADGVTAAAWQPSQVVFTLMISVCLGMESFTRWKALSMVLTIAGALCLVFLGGSSDSDDEVDTVLSNATSLGEVQQSTKDYYLVGQLFFFSIAWHHRWK